MTGYDRKELTLASSEEAGIGMEVDLTGMGDWVEFRRFEMKKDAPEIYSFPRSFQAYWVRFRSDRPTRVTAWLEYR